MGISFEGTPDAFEVGILRHLTQLDQGRKNIDQAGGFRT